MSNNTTATQHSPMPQMDLLLERSIPGFAILSRILSQWFSLDVTFLAGALFFVGAAWTPLQVVTSNIYWAIVRFFTATVTIGPADKLSRDVLAYVAAEVAPRQGTRILTAKSENVTPESTRHYFRSAPYITQLEEQLREEKMIPIDYLPSFESIFFTFGWNVIVVSRHSNSTKDAEEFKKAPTGEESVVVMCLGRSVEPVKRFLEHCRKYTEHSRDNYVAIRTIRGGYDGWAGDDNLWGSMVLRPARPMSTVHFDETVKASLVSDISQYLNPRTKEFYMSRGIPYRRGYLLHGPPGTGKTSLSLALASLFRMDLYLLHLPTIQHDGDRRLNRLLMSLPRKCIVLIEDVDALGLRRTSRASEKESNKSSNQCTLSGLLNALDGVTSHEGRIVLMTTNHPEHLDRALVRPGRIDRSVYLGHISQDSARMMFLRMYSKHNNNNNTHHVKPVFASSDLDETAKSAEASPWERKEVAQISDVELAGYAVKFSSEIPEETFTPAQVQGYLLKYWDSPENAASNIKEWVPHEIKLMEEEKEAIAKYEEEAKKKEKDDVSQVAKIIREAVKNVPDSSDQDEKDDKKPKTRGKSQRAKAKLEKAVEKELARLETTKNKDADDGKKNEGKGAKEDEEPSKLTKTEGESESENDGGDEKEECEVDVEQKTKMDMRAKRRKSDAKALVNGKDVSGPNKTVDEGKGGEGNVDEQGAQLHTPPVSD